jgi:hypothetical protein
MTQDAWYKIRARAFQAMRGMVAPGMEDHNTPEWPDFDGRRAAWLAWNGVHSHLLEAVREAIEAGESRCP